MSYQKVELTKTKGLPTILGWIMAIYVYLSMLPSRSVYVTIIPYYRYAVLLLVNILFFFFIQKYKGSGNKGVWLFLFGFIFASVLSIITNNQLLSSDIYYIVNIDLIIIFCLLPLKMQAIIYNRFIKIGAILVFFGLIEYIIHTFVGFNIYLATNVERGEESAIFYDHGIFNIYPQEPIPRFQGIFREAGMLGICAGLLLFNAQNIKRLMIIIWAVGGFFALSLSYYALFGISVLYHLIVTRIFFNIKSIIILVVIFTSAIIVAMPIMEEAIFDRIELYREAGADNRTDKYLNDDIQKLSKSPDILWGYGNNSFVKKGYTWGNAGFKSEFYKYGLFLIFIFIVSFVALLNYYPYSRLQKLIAFLLFLIIFYVVDCKYSIHIYIIILSMFNPYVVKSITNIRGTVIKRSR